MKTLLLSTSSLWNCGDDFIREGVMELMQFRPDVRILWWNRGYGITDTYANDLRINLPHVDYVILAGTYDIRKDLECSPCFQLDGTERVENCPYNYECLNSISVNEVYEVVTKKLRSD